MGWCLNMEAPNSSLRALWRGRVLRQLLPQSRTLSILLPKKGRLGQLQEVQPLGLLPPLGHQRRSKIPTLP